MHCVKYCAFIALAVCVSASCDAMEQEQPSNKQQDEYVVLVTSEGHEFFVPKEIALLSGTMSSMLANVGSDFQSDEMQTQIINFREINGATLEIVIKILSRDAVMPSTTMRWYKELLNALPFSTRYDRLLLNALSLVRLQEVILAINFLDVELKECVIDTWLTKYIVQLYEQNLQPYGLPIVVLPYFLAQSDDEWRTVEECIENAIGTIFPAELTERFKAALKKRRSGVLSYITSYRRRHPIACSLSFTLITDDGQRLIVPKDVVHNSKKMTSMLDDLSFQLEKIKQQQEAHEIRVPGISGESLKEIIALLPVENCDYLRWGLWAKHRYTIEKPLNAYSIEQLEHVIFAANFLEIPELVEYAEAAFVMKCVDVDENQFNKLKIM